MELYINKKQLKSILESYYREKYDESVEINIKHKIVFSGYFTSSSKIVQVTYELTRKEKLLNQEIKITEEISLEEILQIFRESITNYEIETISEDANIDYTGYYDDQVSSFNGIKLNIKNKQVKRELKQK